MTNARRQVAKPSNLLKATAPLGKRMALAFGFLALAPFFIPGRVGGGYSSEGLSQRKWWVEGGREGLPDSGGRCTEPRHQGPPARLPAAASFLVEGHL
jgi:hypothetical protein